MLTVGAVGWAQLTAHSAPATALPDVRPNGVTVTIPDLRQADEAAVQGEWMKLQSELRQAELLDPAAVIPLYGQFLDRGGDRFGAVALAVVSRVGRLYSTDLRQFDRALEGYDWAIAVYPQHPDLPRIRAERQAVEKAQAQQARLRTGLEPLPVPPVKVVAPLTRAAGAPLTVPPITSVKAPSAAPWPAVAPLKLALPNLITSTVRPFAVPPLKLPTLDLALPAQSGTYAGWESGNGRPVTTLAQGAGGELWVGTEDSGVWRYTNPTTGHPLTLSTPGGLPSGRWTQFTEKDGLSDNNVYALATDKQGRVWAGTLNHGVSVWDGKTWRNYGVLEGPLGERVFDIAVCPTDGDVWIATNAGLTRYSIAKDSWSHLTRANGLPSEAVKTVAFDWAGNIIVGTQCEGLALAEAAEDYQSWRRVQGPEQMPLTPTGKGLPSSLINDVLVADDGTIYAATATGLAWSRDAGHSWNYVRGRDYAAKVAGLPAGAPAGWMDAEKPGLLLAEDYVTSLAQDKAGRLWVGHWVKGSEVLEMKGGALGGIKDVVAQEKSGFVKAILPVESGGPLLARYDEGIGQAFGSARRQQGAAVAPARLGVLPPVAQTGDGLLEVGAEMKAPDTPAQGVRAAQGNVANTVRLPSPLVAPKLEELNDLLRRVRAVAADKETGSSVMTLADDWTTQGDWLGRYGRYYARLHAMTSPTDYVWGAGAQAVPYAARIGKNVPAGDSLRYWVHWLYTDNPRSLEMPAVYFDSRLKKGLASRAENNSTNQKYRRQAEIDDHGEVYPMPLDGPHIYVSLQVPRGDYFLSLYNFNKDGQDGYNRLRDYHLSLRSHPANLPLESIEGFEGWPELARGRMRDFRGGVYKRFLVRGPQTLTVQVSRNYSFNTILAGVFLDKVTEQPEPYFAAPLETLAQARKNRRAQAARALDKKAEMINNVSEAKIVDEIWRELERIEAENPSWWATQGRGVYARLLPWLEAARLRASDDQMPQVYESLGTCYYQLRMFERWEAFQKRRGLTPAREIEKGLVWDGKGNSSGEGRAAVIRARMERQKAMTQSAAKSVAATN